MHIVPKWLWQIEHCNILFHARQVKVIILKGAASHSRIPTPRSEHAQSRDEEICCTSHQSGGVKLSNITPSFPRTSPGIHPQKVKYAASRISAPINSNPEPLLQIAQSRQCSPNSLEIPSFPLNSQFPILPLIHRLGQKFAA